MKLRVNDEYKNFYELLDFGHGKYDIRDVFRDFVVIFAIAIKNRVLYEQDDEDIYLKIINKYEKSERKYFIKMICELINIYFRTKEIKDVLGEIYTQIGAISKNNQQFFTPYYIANAMGKLIIDKSEKNKEEYIKVYDPACGSGVLLLGYINEAHNNKIDYKNNVLVVARDVDFICVCMTYIQFSIYEIPAIVILGNTLINEVKKIFYTPQICLGEWDQKIERKLAEMVKGIKYFASEAKKIIKSEKKKINDLHREISEYETLICVIGQTEAVGQVQYYREKINQCYSKIEISMENIKNSEDRIATMRAIEKFVKRSEKNA